MASGGIPRRQEAAGVGSGGRDLCLVCRDRASGRHYGAPSCDGCRAFFKRSVRRNMQYRCKEENNCIVDKARRNQCQACRFAKCLSVNMNKDSVQHERRSESGESHQSADQNSQQYICYPPPQLLVASRIQMGLPLPQLYDRRWWTSTNDLTYSDSPTLRLYRQLFPNHTNHDAQHSSASLEPNVRPNRNITSSASSAPVEQSSRMEGSPVYHSTVCGHSSTQSQEPVEEKSDEGESTAVVCIEEASDSDISVGQEPEAMVMATESEEPSSDEGCDMTPEKLISMGVGHLSASLVLTSVMWIRDRIDVRKLSESDQATLIKHTWCPLFILDAARTSLPMDEDALVKACKFKGSDERDLCRIHICQLQSLIREIRSLNLSDDQYACLKAICLFRSESPHLLNPRAVQAVCEQMTTNLYLVCTEHSPATMSTESSQSAHNTESVNQSQQNLETRSSKFHRCMALATEAKKIDCGVVEKLLFNKEIGHPYTLESILAQGSWQNTTSTNRPV